MRPQIKVVALAAILITACTPALCAATDDCLSCHSKRDPKVETGALAGSVHASISCGDCHVDAKVVPHPRRPGLAECSGCHPKEGEGWKGSAHASGRGPTCSGCHGGHQVMPASTKGGKASAKLKVADLCGTCHAETASAYSRSIHRTALEKGIGGSPTCTDCHGAHSIEGPRSDSSSVAPKKVPATCGSCHADFASMSSFRVPSDRVDTYKDSFHGTVLEMGELRAANCASCHGAHGILQSSDPASPTNQANLPKTCGKCHPGAGKGFATVKFHQAVGPEGARGAWYVRVFYTFFIALLIAGFLLHISAETVGRIRGRKRGESRREG